MQTQESNSVRTQEMLRSSQADQDVARLAANSQLVSGAGLGNILVSATINTLKPETI